MTEASTKPLDEIIASVSPEAMRDALEEKRDRFEALLAERVVAYEIEKANPMPATKEDREAQKVSVKDIERDIRKWAWALEEVGRRLGDSVKALHGNRAQRRSKKS